jgi:hypothetical protein
MKQEIKSKLDRWVSKEYDWYIGEVGKNITWGRMNDYTEDLCHMMLQSLYQLDEDKVKEMLENGKIKGWLLRGASMQIRSSTSPFYLTFRKHKMSARSGVIDSDNGETNTPSYELEIEPEEELMECLDRAVNQLHWYQKALYDKKFKEGWVLEEIHKFYGIGKRHLIRDLNKALEEIRLICKNAK